MSDIQNKTNENVDLLTDNATRKAIIMKNHDTILGTTTKGDTVNVAMVSKWDKVDLGSASIEINLNGSATRPTYNDEKEIALLEDISSAVSEEELNEALKDKVSFTDISSDENPNRKAIILNNHDSILGKTTKNGAVTIGMVSKWDKVDLGSSTVEINLNGSAERPTYNDKAEIALMSDVEAISGSFDNFATKEELTAETEARSNADVQLQNDLQAEATARVEGDKTVQTAVDTVAKNLETEISERKNVDKVHEETIEDLGNELDAEVERAIAKENEIEKKIENSVNYIDVSTADKPTRKAIILKNDDLLLGTNTSGGSANIAMINKWDIVDLGTSSLPINLNTPKDVRPTVQEEGQSGEQAHKIAYLSDVEAVEGELSNYAEKSHTHAEYALKTDVDATIATEAEARNAADDAIKAEMTNKVGYIEFAEGRKTIQLNNHDTISGLGTDGAGYNIVMVSKWNKVDLGSANIEINLNGKAARPTYNDEKEIALLEDVNASMSTIALVKNNDLQYTLKVGDAIAGTINIPKDQFLKRVDYDANEKDLVFTFITKESENYEVKVNIGDLVDVYTAGNGISLASNAFSINLDVTTQNYIEVSENGLKIVNIDEALAKKVEFTDIATEENPNRKSIVLNNHDTLLGKNTNGEAKNLIMMSKWDKVDIGTTANEVNLNGSAKHPTYNDKEQMAFVSEVEAVKESLTAEATTARAAEKELSDKIETKADKTELQKVANAKLYYPGVKVDTQKLFALTKESTEDDIKAALQIKVASGGYTLPTSAILDECLGKGYQLLSNWMPVSITWNGVAYVFYIVGQSYMMKPTGLYTVALTITPEGNYSVFQAAKVEEFANVNDIPTNVVKYTDDSTSGDRNVVFENDMALMAQPNMEELENKVEVEGGVHLIKLNKWNVVDLGTPKTIVNINTPKGERPTVQEQGQSCAEANKIAYVSDIDALSDKMNSLEESYVIDITNLLSANDSQVISNAIGGIDNLKSAVTNNKVVIGSINNGEVTVSIRNLGNVTTLYYVLDTVAGYTVNEINITNNSGELSKEIRSHSMMTEEMVIDDLTTKEATLPLSANQGKVLNDKVEDLKKTYVVDLSNTDEAKKVHLELIEKYKDVTDVTPVNDVFIKNNRLVGLVQSSNLIPITGARLKQGSVHFFVDTPVRFQKDGNIANSSFGKIEIYFAEDGTAEVMTSNDLIESGGYILNYENGGLAAKATLVMDNGYIRLKGINDHTISSVNVDNEIASKVMGNLDIQKYIEASNYEVQVLNKLEESYISDLGTPENINGQPYNAATNNYVIGRPYLSFAKFDESLVFHYDLYALNGTFNMGYIGKVFDAIKLNMDTYDSKLADLEKRIAALEGTNNAETI